MGKKIWHEPKVAKLAVKDVTRGSGSGGDNCGGLPPNTVTCS